MSDAERIRQLERENDALRAELARWKPRRAAPPTPEEWARVRRLFRERFPGAGPGTYNLTTFMEVYLG